MGEGGLEQELLQVKVRGAPAILGSIFLVQQFWVRISCSEVSGSFSKKYFLSSYNQRLLFLKAVLQLHFLFNKMFGLGKTSWQNFFGTSLISFSPVWKYHMDIIRICWWVVVFLQCEQCTMCTFCWWVGSTNLVSWKSFPLVNSAQCAVCTFCWCVEKLCPSVNSSQSTMCTFCWWVGMLVLFPSVDSAQCAQ